MKNDAPIKTIWQWGLLGKTNQEPECSLGRKGNSWEKRISSMPYQASTADTPLRFERVRIRLDGNFPGRNPRICLQLVPTENKPSVHWHEVPLNSLRWTYFKRKLPIFFSLNLRGTVNASFSSLKHWQLLCFLNIYYKQICNSFWI